MSGTTNGAAGGVAAPSSPRRSLAASDAATAPPKPYIVVVSRRFLVLSVFSSILLAFAVGRAARILLIVGPNAALLAPHDQSSMRNRPDYHEGPMHNQHRRRKKALPPPILMDGKEVPRTVYTSKNFDTAASATSSTLLIQKPDGTPATGGSGGGQGQHVCVDRHDGSKKCEHANHVDGADDGGGGESAAATEVDDAAAEDDDDDDEEDEHLPAGQHLLVDIKDVDGDFLNSEERLAQATLDVVSESKLTLLSYHCHTLIPTGVSCVGVLLESHISFHTWPDEGVITLDLFTCGSAPLLPVIPVIEKLFGVPRKTEAEGEEVEPPIAVWAHKLRGFREHKDPNDRNPLDADLGKFYLGLMDYDMKKEIASVQTEYQTIDIYDVIHPRFRDYASYRKSLSGDGSYEATHPELFQPDRIVFLDGIMQSTLFGDAPYHEALVHPGMFAHPDPRRVAIIGGGEGATLREVLKHRTVTSAVMVEIDEVMVNVCREHLPSWSDCSDLRGSTDWCIEDGRADVYFEDALAWFLDRFSVGGEREQVEGAEELNNRDPFDVIIMDALDPQDNVAFADALYNNGNFLHSLYSALTDDGVIVMQLGESPTYKDPSDQFSRNKNRHTITKLLEEVGFESIHVYEESHSGFLGAWSFLAAFKDAKTRSNWYASVSEVENAIRERILPTKSGSPALKYFDGSTMYYYQVPPKGFETVYCRRVPTPPDCLDLVGSRYLKGANVPIEQFETKAIGSGENAGRGLFAKVDIPKGAFLGMETHSQRVLFKPRTLELIEGLVEGRSKKLGGGPGAAAALAAVYHYMHRYGFQTEDFGEQEVYVDSTIMALANNGCDSTEHSFGAANVRHERHDHGEAFNAVLERKLPYVSSSGEFALRDINAGEEIRFDSPSFVGSTKGWKGNFENLRDQCLGQGDGLVTDGAEEKNKESAETNKENMVETKEEEEEDVVEETSAEEVSE